MSFLFQGQRIREGGYKEKNISKASLKADSSSGLSLYCLPFWARAPSSLKK